ncbi:TPA: hypothetical protein ACGUTA_004492 [Vibrio vulnificus]
MNNFEREIINLNKQLAQLRSDIGGCRAKEARYANQIRHLEVLLKRYKGFSENFCQEQADHNHQLELERMKRDAPHKVYFNDFTGGYKRK